MSCFIFVPTIQAQGRDITTPKIIAAPSAEFKELKHTKSGRIDKIIDGLTLLLADGTIIRLASIDIPDFALWQGAIYSEAALELLETTLSKGTEVMVYQTRMAKKGRLTRMKHELAHIKTKKDNIWIQGLLLANGLARVYTTPNANEMLSQMYRAEQTARKDGIGFWSKEDGEFPIMATDNIELLTAAMGDFVIVEGVVEKAATVRNTLYLNFGKDWKSDFTVTITPAIRKKLARDGINLMNLGGESVRVRGWLREYNGPMIELEDTAHFEYTPNTPPNNGTDTPAPLPES